MTTDSQTAPAPPTPTAPVASVTIDKGALKAMSIVCSTDPSRLALHHIHVANGRAAASDGHIALIAPAETEGEVYLRAKMATTFLRDKSIARLVTCPNADRTLPVSFPDVDRVIPDATDTKAKVGFSVASLERLVKAAKAAGSVGILFHLRGPNDALRIELDGGIYGAVMPRIMR